MEPRNPRDYWWTADADDCHAQVFAACGHLKERQSYRKAAYVHFLRLYSNRLAQDMTGEDFTSAIDSGEKIRLNVVKSCIDTATAMVSTDRARPQYLSIGGTRATRRRAERQSKWVLGALLKTKHYTLAQDVFRDAAIFGTSIQWPDHHGDYLFQRRILPDELIIDDTDSRTDKPIQAFVQYNVDRYWFAEFWPDDKEAILAAECVDDSSATREGLTDPVTVTLAWKPAQREGATEAGEVGRMSICVSNKTLLDEEYTSADYPWAVWRWNTSPIGYLGMGLAEELAPIQVEVNYVAQKIQKLMTLATSMVWVEKGSGVKNITNEDWARYEYRGKPPIFQQTASVSGEYFNHLDRLYSRAYELSGISQLSSGAVKPAGIDSGEGLRTYFDISQKRFMHTGLRWAQHTLDVGELLLEVAREMTEEGYNPTVIYPGRGDAEEIDFKKAALEKARYVVRVQPAALLPEEPAGKVEMLGKLAQAAPELAKYLTAMLADVPDVEFAARMIRAPFEIAEKHVELILDKGTVEAPHPMMDLGIARLVAQRELLMAQIEGIGEDRIEALRRYIVQIDALQKTQTAQLPAPPAPPVPPDGMMSKPTPPPEMLAQAAGAPPA